MCNGVFKQQILPYILSEMKHFIRHKRPSFICMTTFHKILTVLNTANPQSCFKYILIMKSSESFMRKQMYVQQTNIWKEYWKQSSICSIAARRAKHNSCSCHNIQGHLITNNKTINPINPKYFTIKYLQHSLYVPTTYSQNVTELKLTLFMTCY
jgi:hypothetical protein